MQLRHVLTILLFALGCAEAVIGRHAQIPRDTTDSATTTGASPAQLSSTANGSSSKTASSGSTSTTTQPGSTTSAETSSQASSTSSSSSMVTSSVESTTPVIDLATSATLSAATAQSTLLPLEPEVTPAIGVAGIFLIIAGIALGFVGIRHKWLYIFLSTALLASLSVTVLIIYVMNPPVTDAVQGAYLVAAVVSGLILGSVALVFQEVADGLGCLLGGFCFAMWLLVLSPGGLIKSSGGKVALIVMFCLSFYSLYFSRYTRNYGLLGCTAFAGSMTTIIGIDCYSGAGLKEFWIYIWNLNGNEFPLYTTSYPVTRGIRVEVACTIILFFFGVLSQFRIWKVIRDKQAQWEAERVRWDESREQLEEAVGQTIEAQNHHHRAQWEAVYGDGHYSGPNTGSGVRSSLDSVPKKSASVREREIDGIQMRDMPVSSKRPSKSDERPSVTIRVASDEEDPKVGAETPYSDDPGNLSRSASRKSRRSLRHEDSNSSSEQHLEGSSVRDWSPAQAAPTIVPLPFAIPGAIEEVNEDHEPSEHGSGGTRVTAGQSVGGRRGRHLQYSSLKDREEQERMPIIQNEDDRASSVAATMDDEGAMSPPALSDVPSPFQFDFERAGILAESEDERDRSPGPRDALIDAPIEEDDDEAVTRPQTVQEETLPEVVRKSSNREGRKSMSGDHRRSSASRRSVQDGELEDEDGSVSMAGSLRDHLPQKMSKVALTYRTNEWAKHIADADKPEIENVLALRVPGLQGDDSFTEEAVRPVDVKSLQQTVPTETSRNPYRQSMKGHGKSASNQAATPVHPLRHSSSQTSMLSQSRNTMLSGQPRIATHMRNVSAPLATQTLVESPIEDILASSGPYRNFSAPSSSNLMDQRNQRLMQHPMSTSFNALASSSIYSVAPSESASIRHADDGDNMSLAERKQRLHDDEDDNMTLSERRVSLQHQREREGSIDHSLRPRQGTWPVPGRDEIPHNGRVSYNAHQPRRNRALDAVKQNNTLARWRQSLQADRLAKEPLLVDEHARQQLLTERRYAEWQQQREEYERSSRENIIDMAMRSGQLQGAHQAAMRKMQAQINRKATL